MPRGNVGVYKAFYKGNNDDYIVFVEDPTAVKNWKQDRTIPLAQVVNGYKIFVTHKQGAQGIHDGASKGSLQSEFGTSNEDECIAMILEKGEIQESASHERVGTTNDSKGSLLSH